MNQQLYDQLIEAGNVLVQWEETEKTIQIYSDKIEEQNNTLEKARKDIKKKPKFYVLRLVLGILATYFGGFMTIGIGIMFLISLIFALVSLIVIPIGLFSLFVGIFPDIMGSFIVAPVAPIITAIPLLIALVIATIGICLLVVNSKSTKKHVKLATQKYEELKVDFEEKNKILEDEINRLREELDAFLAENKKHLEFLPVDYQTVHAVGFMLKAVQNLRADTLKEAINLYDQELKHLEAMAVAERQRLQNENMIYAMQLLNRNMESMSENQARANQILRSIDAVQAMNAAHHW